MSSNPFIFNGVPVKKIDYGRRKGILEVTLRDEMFDILYKGKARLNDKREVKQMLGELKQKGFDLFDAPKWF